MISIVRRWCLALLLAALLPAARAGAEDEVAIKQDNTPLFAMPAEGARVVVRANAGHRLFVRGRAGNWLKVFTPQYILVGEDMWVQAERVEPAPTRPEPPPAPAADEAEPPPLASVFRVDVGGTPGLDVRASCGIVENEEGLRRLRERSDLVPVAYEFVGLALSCTVQKRDDFGRLEVALLAPDGTLIATAETAAPFGSVHVRSAGPWGDVDASRGPSRIFLLPDAPRPRLGRPPAGNPVPPFRSPPVPPMSGFAAPPLPAD